MNFFGLSKRVGEAYRNQTTMMKTTPEQPRHTLQALQNFLDNHDIPVIPSKPLTFLGIAKQPHYENVLSNLLAFYFDPKQAHGLGFLFLDCLLELVMQKAPDKNLSFADPIAVSTEYGTESGRIDIRLADEAHAVVIENKVFHHLNNDLEEYWKAAIFDRKYEEVNCVGIVLSLYPVSDIAHEHFINLTHGDFLRRVMGRMGPYMMQAEDKYVVFLKDLYQNTISLSEATMKSDDLEFYFDNRKKINQLIQLERSVNRHIVTEVEKVGLGLDGVELDVPRKTNPNRKRLRYYKSRRNADVVIAVVFEKIKDDGTMYVVVEVRGETLKALRKNNSLRAELSAVLGPDGSEGMKLEEVKDDGKSWSHVYRRDYQVPKGELENLGRYLDRRIVEDGFLVVVGGLDG